MAFIKIKKGFTLIEVLVVVTIISVLIAINLIAIDRYQNSANDAAIGTNLSQLRKVAAFIYTDENSYRNICDTQNATLNDASEEYPELGAIETGVRNITDSDPECHADETEYCVRISLPSSGHFCVDATGFAGKTTNDNCQNSTGKRDCSP